jgi:hypothetical protein
MCLLVYLVFRNQGVIEGLENAGQSTTSSSNGIGGGAADYVTRLTDAFTKKTDILLISKYRTEYEKAVVRADDMINLLMLEEVLSLDTNKPDMKSFVNIANLSQAKDGLNKVLKFVDKS